ncbi:transglutaminase-like domain-containing protein [Tenacibaculum maritimum]|uniref:transglutaminase-like domain-containing protein n=1 Tax=Tenacibaculum maritimum TaxID=107401 RepID=UPI00388FE6F2
MSIASINKSLSRKIKINTKYDKYLVKTPCKSTFLGKYDTTGGMKQMKEWTLKHQNYTKKLSKVLKGKNLPETITNIYNFLYNHIQYDADGYDQQLKTPSCTWNRRFEGVDCKSFSVFASSILINLNIPHSFRKVVQPYEPSRWSHVYVIIPYGKNTLVIDATKKENTEVEYIKKEDMEVHLPYYGLHGYQESMDEFVTDNEIFDGFKKVIDFFKKAGVSETILQTIVDKVKESYYKYNGFNFKFTLKENGLIIDNEIINLGEKQQGLNAIVTGAAIKKVAGPLLKKLLNNVDFGKEIGKVLKYGLTSWGASQTPETYPSSSGYKAYLNEIERYANAITPENVGKGLSDLDKYFSFLIYQHYYWMNNIGRAYSSRLAMNGAIVKFRELRKRIVDKLLQEYQKNGVNFKIEETSTTEMLLWKASLTKFGRGIYKYRKFEATNLNYIPSLDTVNYANDAIKNVETIATNQSSEIPVNPVKNTVVSGPPKTETAGIGKGAVAIVGLVLAGGYVLLNKDNNNEVNNNNKK